MAEIFEQAARSRLRFETRSGNLSVEELWQLPLKGNRQVAGLDEIAIGLHERLKSSSVSFVDDAETPDPAIQLCFDVVKRVIDVKKAERQASLKEAAKSETKQKLLSIIASKEHQELTEKSVDELREMLASL